MERKIIEMLVSAKTERADYQAGELYSVRAEVADRFVREKVAKYIEVSLDDEEGEQESDAEMGTGEDSERPWRETVRPGETYQWQITLGLPRFREPRIEPKFRSDDEDGGNSGCLGEVGGDGAKPSSEQANAIDFLAQHEADLFPKVMAAVATHSKDFREDWRTQGEELSDRVVPEGMTAAQAVARISFTRVYISGKSRNGIAYVEIWGECTWDPGHGFRVVMYRDRIVDVAQQGSGWTEEKS